MAIVFGVATLAVQTKRGRERYIDGLFVVCTRWEQTKTDVMVGLCCRFGREQT